MEPLRPHISFLIIIIRELMINKIHVRFSFAICNGYPVSENIAIKPRSGKIPGVPSR